MRYLFYRQPSGDDTLLVDDLQLFAIDAKSFDTSILVINANSNKSIWLEVQDEKPIDTPPTLKELIVQQARDDYCKAETLNVGQFRFELNIDQRGLLI